MEKLSQTAIQAALEAGNKIMEVYEGGDFEVTQKEDDSPLTQADRRAHQTIVQHLSQTDLPILSEESAVADYSVRRDWKTFWMVDPLDGTKEFIKRNGEFTVNIALISDGIPAAGVVYAPVLASLYFTQEDSAYKIENITSSNQMASREAIKLQPRPKSDEIIIVASKSHMSPETQKLIEHIQAECPQKKVTTVSMGSSLKLCLVAEGKADFYPRYAPTMEWDTAAGHAVCRAAGVPVTIYESSEALMYNQEDLLNPWFEVGSWK